jgi:hypothetical protein
MGIAPQWAAFVAIGVIVVAALGVGSIITGAPQNAVPSTAACNQPAYLARLASQVESNPKFTSQSHGLEYILASGDNQSATTGEVDGKPYSAPPETTLSFYSHGTSPNQPCLETQGPTSVVGALWVGVPINPDLSYNFSGMTVYFTPGVFVNGTSLETGSCLINPSGFSIPQFGRSTANSSEPGELALALQSGSTATICVRYSGTQYTQDLGLTTLQPSIFVETCSQLAGGGTSCQGTPTNQVTVASSPQSIVISNETDVLVQYTLSAASGSKGFYMLGIPDNCPSIPLAVGYQPGQLTTSNFPGIGPIPCPAPVVQVDILAVSGASAIYLGY